MKITSLVLAAIMLATPASAAEHVVKMLNFGPDGTRMAFDPDLVRAASGDTVVFVPEDKGHAATSVIVPNGATPWEGALSAETRVTVSTPGIYLFKSSPFFSAGMIGMIIVDSEQSNRSEIEAFRPRGKMMRARFEALLNQL